MATVKEIIKLDESTASWYGRVEARFLVRFNKPWENMSHAAINCKKYCDNEETGWLRGNGNLGSWAAIYTDLRMFQNEMEVKTL